MDEAILSSVAGSIIENLGSPAFEGIEWGFKDEITNVEKSVSTTKAVRQGAEAKQHNSEAIKLQPKSPKYVMCDVDDLLDEISAEDLRWKVMTRDKICIDLNRYFFFSFSFFIAIFFI